MPTIYMDYFAAIAFRVEQIDKLAQNYLDKLPFMPNNEITKIIWEKAWDIFEAKGKNFNRVPEWVANVMDNGVPFQSETNSGPRNGSLYYALALSLPSLDAHLRNYLEVAEGREKDYLDFPILAEKGVVAKLSGINP